MSPWEIQDDGRKAPWTFSVDCLHNEFTSQVTGGQAEPLRLPLVFLPAPFSVSLPRLSKKFPVWSEAKSRYDLTRICSISTCFWRTDSCFVFMSQSRFAIGFWGRLISNHVKLWTDFRRFLSWRGGFWNYLRSVLLSSIWIPCCLE